MTRNSRSIITRRLSAQCKWYCADKQLAALFLQCTVRHKSQTTHYIEDGLHSSVSSIQTVHYHNTDTLGVKLNTKMLHKFRYLLHIHFPPRIKHSGTFSVAKQSVSVTPLKPRHTDTTSAVCMRLTFTQSLTECLNGTVREQDTDVTG